jgi:hypothetical protein
MSYLSELQRDPTLVIVLCAMWAWISLSLIVRMWLVHRQTRTFKKLLWSLMLLVPLFGWLMYAAFFQPLAFNDVVAPTEHSGGIVPGGADGS